MIVSDVSAALVGNAILGLSVVVLVCWVLALVDAARHSAYFQDAGVSQGLTWALLILMPLVGAVFVFVMHPSLKRARAAAIAGG